MLAEFTSQDLTAILVALIITAVPATIAAVSSIRQRRDIRTRNGKTVGEVVDDSANTLEVIQAQQHQNTKDISGVHDTLERVEGKVDRINGRVDRVDRNLDKHLDEVGDGIGKLSAWVRKKMAEEDG